MFCPECGTELPDYAKFCNNCGNPQIHTVPNTNKNNITGSQKNDDIGINYNNFVFPSKYWYNKGVEFSRSNEYEKALHAYNQALTFEDKDPDIWNNKCYVLIKLGKYEEAIKAGNKGVELAPYDYIIWDTLRDAYIASNNPGKASECDKIISNLQGRSVEKTPSTGNFGKVIGIFCGLFILLIIIGAIINNWGTIARNGLGILYYLIFGILLLGILYEGWKAVIH